VRPHRKDSGLTLIELLVVITILGFLATIVTVNYVNHLRKGKVKTAETQISMFMEALEMYYLDNNQRYPSANQGLEALTEPTDDAPRGYLKQDFVPLDPWDNPYEYVLEGDIPVITSWGADGSPGGDGANADIISSDIGRPKDR